MSITKLYTNDFIRSALTRIAEEHDVTILHACEAGSRAWGFASPDSDYDVRFIYTQRVANYLAIEKVERTITEFMEDNELDFHGWDIHKAMGLLVKGNAALVEWLRSPIIYLQDDQFAKDMEALLPTTIPLMNAFAHYRSQAKKFYIEHIRDSASVPIKKYFYSIRPLLAAQWILKNQSIPPVPYMELIEDAFEAGSQGRARLMDLLARKVEMNELDLYETGMDLEYYIKHELIELDKVKYETTVVDTSDVNRVLKSTILRCDDTLVLSPYLTSSENHHD